jgi:hypothetical protein
MSYVCDSNADCPGDRRCLRAGSHTVNYTLTCTNASVSDTKTLTVIENIRGCTP